MRNFINLKPRRLNIAQWLRKNKGGNWKYNNNGSWICDDELRYVLRVAMDFTEEGGPVGYYLYGGDNPGWIYFN